MKRKVSLVQFKEFFTHTCWNCHSKCTSC